MESRIAAAIKPTFPPVTLSFAEEVPAGSVQFAEGKWGCVMWLLASAARGKTAAADRASFGCLGGGVGLGFGNQYENWPGGVECFYRFLSSGNADSEEGRAAGERVAPFMRRESLQSFLHGEGYLKTPEQAKAFVDALPIVDVPAKAVVFAPLDNLAAGQVPEVVIFLADPDQLAALIVLANYGRRASDNVIVPFAAGCQSVGILAYREARADRPRAVLGLVDISARLFTARQLGPNLFTLALPWSMFLEMEGNVAGSFLERPTWASLLAERARR